MCCVYKVNEHNIQNETNNIYPLKPNEMSPNDIWANYHNSMCQWLILTKCLRQVATQKWQANKEQKKTKNVVYQTLILF